MDLSRFLMDNKRRMDERIFSVLPAGHSDPEVSQFYDILRDYPERKGKGIRGSLCLLSCEMFGGDPTECLDTAAAIELFESWVLVHDDIEDGSDMRRGDTTLHLKYGVPIALNAGDAMSNRMWTLILRNRDALGERLTFRIADEFLFTIDQTTEGQHMELSWTRNGRLDMDEMDYYSMCGRKTAWYTCISPLRLGGMIGGAPEECLEAMKEIGRDMGIAFQIQDDVLNLIGDERKYGKEIHGDLWEGKRTLALIHAVRGSNTDTRARLEASMTKPREMRREEDIRLVLRAMDECGSIEFARRKARELAAAAEGKFNSALAGVPESQAKQAVREMIYFVVSRDK